MDTTHHKEVLKKNNILLENTLDLDLFLHRLEPYLGKTCIDSVRDQQTLKEKTRKLLWLLGTVPKEKYDFFCKVIAGLYPVLFKVLTGREAEKRELDFYMQTYTSELRESVLAAGNVPDNEIDRPIDLDTQYVKLALQEKSNMEVPLGEDILPADYMQNLENVKDTDGLDIDEILPKPSRGTSTLLKGRAGVGKSTLTQYLIRSWARGKWESSKTCVFLLNLRKLVHVDRDVTITELLGMYAEYVTDTPHQNQSLQWLKNNAHNVMILTDGIDEIPDIGPLLKRTPKLNLTEGTKARPLDWCVNLMQKTILPDCTKVLIGRPFDDLKKLPCDRVVDVLGLTEKRILEFIEKNVKSCKRDTVRHTLEGNPVLLSVCSITFYCSALCRVLEFNSDINGMLLNTYTRITAYLIMGLAARKASEKATSMFMSESLQSCLPYLAALAHRGLTESQNGLARLVFTEDDLSASGISPECMKEARKLGLLEYSMLRDPVNPHEPKLQTQFIHLSVQEFLSAAKMVVPCRDDESEIKVFESGRFNMRDIFAFGIAFDTESRLVKGIKQAVGKSRKVETDVEGHLIKTFKDLSQKSCSSDLTLQSMRIAYETQRQDFAKELGEKVLTDGKFTVGGLAITAVDMMAVFFVLRETNVESLDISPLMAVGSVKEIQEFLGSNTSLQNLHINSVREESMPLICEGVRSSRSLTDLHLTIMSSSALGAGCVSDVLRSSCHLESLWLEMICFQLPPYKYNILDTNVYQDIYPNRFATALMLSPSNYTLLITSSKRLELRCVRIANKDMRAVSESISHSSTLEYLHVKHSTQMRYRGLQYLCDAIKQSQTLKHITLNMEEGIADEGIKCLADAFKNSVNLKKVEFDETPICLAGWCYLSVAMTEHEKLFGSKIDLIYG